MNDPYELAPAERQLEKAAALAMIAKLEELPQLNIAYEDMGVVGVRHVKGSWIVIGSNPASQLVEPHISARIDAAVERSKILPGGDLEWPIKSGVVQVRFSKDYARWERYREEDFLELHDPTFHVDEKAAFVYSETWYGLGSIGVDKNGNLFRIPNGFGVQMSGGAHDLPNPGFIHVLGQVGGPRIFLKIVRVPRSHI